MISAHSGLPNRRLFTELDRLENGDTFILTVLGEKLAYQVKNIQVVLPDDTSVLTISEGEDLVTLLTCTPYMINTHRLLVTGHRIPYNESVKRRRKRKSGKNHAAMVYSCRNDNSCSHTVSVYRTTNLSV